MKTAKIHLCIDSLAADVSNLVANESSTSVTESLQHFMRTKTYALLFDEQSLFYTLKALNTSTICYNQNCQAIGSGGGRNNG
jgi:hypothetical protein